MARSKGTDGASKNGKGENTSAFFREIFKSRRNLLKNRSNKRVLELWLAAHPGYDEVPKNVQNAMANVKSVMRSNRRGYNKQSPGGATTSTMPKKLHRVSESALERLEILIDECVTTATHLDREGLADIVKALRVARRRVVWKLGVDE